MDWANVDHQALGLAIRGLRLLQNQTQTHLCEVANVAPSTLYKVEEGLQARPSTYRKLCEALQTKPDELLRQEAEIKTKDRLAVQHLASEAVWYAPVDHRKAVPEDNTQLIQNADERSRLGRLKLVPLFACYPNLLMPSGPGATLLELYGRYSTPFNATIYQEALLFCLRGAARLQVGDCLYEVSEGDILGYTNPELRWIEPLTPDNPESLPVRLHWVGADRIGKVGGVTRKRVARSKHAKSRR